ncbi:4-hydroxybenzoate octaprenyltransferase [Planctomycetales bacterium]|nr:4-hydroxybenzoate octaprenyltransferase [Planctomycetales bacterium]
MINIFSAGTLFAAAARYLGLIRFSHTLFALPFALLSYAMAVRLYGFRSLDLLGILLCMVFARSAAMGFNRLADRDIDAENPRTARRHLPLGIVSVGGVCAFVFVCSFGFIASTLLFLPQNPVPLFASVPLLLFLFGYSYTKRWTSAAHFWLGTCLCAAPIAAWVAVRPEFSFAPLLLGLAVLFWTAGFDLIYATQDTEFDAKTGLFSVPGRYGTKAAFCLSAFCHIVSVFFFASVPLAYPLFGIVFEAGVAAAAIFLFFEHFLARPKRGAAIDLDRINIAFFQMNVIVSVGLFIFGAVDLLV